jgi:hypothetical protein
MYGRLIGAGTMSNNDPASEPPYARKRQCGPELITWNWHSRGPSPRALSASPCARCSLSVRAKCAAHSHFDRSRWVVNEINR